MMNKVLKTFNCIQLFACFSEFVITSGPEDTKVCMNDMAVCTCGFEGTTLNPATTIPDWIIITRATDGSVISNVTIDGEEIVDNKHDGLRWVINQINATSSPDSRLMFGPVNMTHNQSSYQCVFKISTPINGLIQRQSVMSSIGTLTVLGENIRFTVHTFAFLCVQIAA